MDRKLPPCLPKFTLNRDSKKESKKADMFIYTILSKIKRVVKRLFSRLFSAENEERQYLDSQIEEEISIIRASGLFDEELYLKANPDVAQANMDPIYHYVKYGYTGRDVPPHFYTKWYVDVYEEVQKSRVNPLIHYIKYGKDLGYQPRPPILELRRMYDYAKENGGIVFEGAPEKVYLERPKVIGNFSGKLEEGEASCPRPYISVLENANIFGGLGLIISGNHILNDELFEYNGEEYGKKSPHVSIIKDKKALLNHNNKSTNTFDIGVNISCGHDANYFHWLIECLPKLLWLDSSNLYSDAPIFILKSLHPNLRAAFDRVNQNKHKTIEIEFGVNYNIKKLIYPSPLSRINDKYIGQSIFGVDSVLSKKWLKELSFALSGNYKSSKKPFRKIFLSRRTGRRTMQDSDELEASLSQVGFETIDVNDYSLDAQIELFSQASVVVAPSGATLTNMLFCQPGAEIVVLVPSHEATNYYLWTNLGNILGLKVQIINCERTFKIEGYFSVHDDYKANTNLVLEVVNNIAI